MKRIGLLFCGANFERQREAVRDIHEVVKKKGDILYVFTSYDPVANTDVPEGAETVYSLAGKPLIDAVIMDDSVDYEYSRKVLMGRQGLDSKHMVFGSTEVEGYASYTLDSYKLVYELVEHLIKVHGCKKINFAADFAWLEACGNEYGGIKAYEDALKANKIPFDPKRKITKGVSIQKGRELWDDMKAAGVDDCDAVLCIHDINAIGLCVELSERGVDVPGDIKVVSIRRSGNSVAFIPDISGGVTDECAEANAAIEALYTPVKKGEKVLKMFEGHGVYGASCGCNNPLNALDESRRKQIVLDKIGAGSQIRAMMNFNDSLEKVSSLEEYEQVIKRMYESLGCKKYAVCLNRKDIPYILNTESEVKFDPFHPFDSTMYVLTGMNDGKDIMTAEFPLDDISPIPTKPGDIVTVMPIVHKLRTFGYVVLINDMLPYEQYNYRIISETLGSSIENLRREMTLKYNINELSELRMRDPLTRLYNRESITSFKDTIGKLEKYTIVMLDMDGLKKINDRFGHEEGNRAIKILADTVNRAAGLGEIVARYGGDEFVVMSPTDSSAYWESLKDRLNAALQEETLKEKLPYTMGVSVGYAVHTPENNYSMDRCFEIADERMYKHKADRKACREN